jgi:hypothetical protein
VRYARREVSHISIGDNTAKIFAITESTLQLLAILIEIERCNSVVKRQVASEFRCRIAPFSSGPKGKPIQTV